MAATQKCQKCNKKPAGVLFLKVGKVQVSVCPACFNDWLDIKDAATDKAFKEWTKK